MKTLRWFLLFFFTLAFGMVQAQDNVKMTINEIGSGSAWNIDVAFENAASGNYTAFQMDLKLPAGFVYEENSLKVDTRLLGHTCSANMGADGLLHIIGYSAGNVEIPGNTGKLFSLTLKAQSGTPDGIYSVEPKNVRFAKRDGNEFSIDANKVEFTYKAAVTEKDYLIIYKVDGKEFKRQTVTEGKEIPEVDQPKKEGHTFTGWKDLPKVMPGHDVTVEAMFTVNKYKLVAKVDGTEYKTVEYEFGAKIVLPEAPSKEGYTFSGWSEAPATMPAHDVEINGTFTVNKYKLVSKVDGTEYKTVEYEFGAKIVLPEAPTKEGHTFSGWSEAPATMPAHDVEINGTFTVNTYYIDYYLNGEFYSRQEVKYGAAIIPCEVEDTAEDKFLGWEGLPETMPAENLVIYGKTEPTGIEELTADTCVDVYNLEGKRVLVKVSWKTALQTLHQGIYVVNGHRVWVK